MENELVSYELSSTLKELGFNHPCLFAYYGKSNISNFKESDHVLCGDRHNTSFQKDGRVSAPLRQQAFRWFREEHDLRVRNYVHGNMSGGVSEYFVIFKFIDNTNETICEVGALTYEKAEIACLKKLIEIVKK